MDLLKRALIPPPEVVLFLFVRQPFAPLNLLNPSVFHISNTLLTFKGENIPLNKDLISVNCLIQSGDFPVFDPFNHRSHCDEMSSCDDFIRFILWANTFTSSKELKSTHNFWNIKYGGRQIRRRRINFLRRRHKHIICCSFDPFMVSTNVLIYILSPVISMLSYHPQTTNSFYNTLLLFVYFVSSFCTRKKKLRAYE